MAGVDGGLGSLELPPINSINFGLINKIQLKSKLNATNKKGKFRCQTNEEPDKSRKRVKNKIKLVLTPEKN